MNMPAPGFYAPAADRYAHMPYVRCGRSGLKLPREIGRASCRERV